MNAELWAELLDQVVAKVPACQSQPCTIEVLDRGWYVTIAHVEPAEHDCPACNLARYHDAPSRVLSTDRVMGTRRAVVVTELVRWLERLHEAAPEQPGRTPLWPDLTAQAPRTDIAADGSTPPSADDLRAA